MKFREEGEIGDSEEEEEREREQARVTIKRRRDSSSPESSREEFRRRLHDDNEQWHRYFGHEASPNRSAFETERGRRRRHFDNGGNEDPGNPRAHSTAGYRNNERPQGSFARGNSQQRPTLRHSGISNATHTAGGKMFKVEPFPKGIKPTDQHHEWTFWLANFEMAIEKAGIYEQRTKAIDLSLHIGEEIRRIIVAKSMLPRENAVEQGFDFYDNVVNKLEHHFRSLTDESVDVASFNSLKQGEKESALEFELRLRQMASRVKETNAAMIRTRYIEGLRDQAIKERAFIDGISFEEVVKMATRKEAIAVKQQSGFTPWNDDRSSVVVAAVSRESRDFNRQSHNRPAGAHSNTGQRSYPTSRNQQGGGLRNRAEERKKDDRCGKCGFTDHRSGTCPAAGATCFKCGDKGHFRHACPGKTVRSVETETPDEVYNKIFE